jgi:hypothetical protein
LVGITLLSLAAHRTAASPQHDGEERETVVLALLTCPGVVVRLEEAPCALPGIVVYSVRDLALEMFAFACVYNITRARAIFLAQRLRPSHRRH